MSDDEVPDLVMEENEVEISISQKKVPVTIITGFLGAGKVSIPFYRVIWFTYFSRPLY